MKKLILFFKRHINRETIYYLIFGGLTTVIGFSSFIVFVYLNMSIAAANTISTVLAVLFAFVTNKAFVFRSKSWEAKLVIKEFLSFCTSRLFTFLVETALLIVLVDILHFNSTIMKGLTMVIVVAGNYVLSKRLVFRTKKI